MAEQGKVSLVTGGSRGIGRAVCLALGGPGDVVVFNHYDPDDQAAEETVALLREKGVTSEYRRFDVGDPQAVQEFFDHVTGAYGRLDNLVNNAGVIRDNFLVRMSMEQWDQVVRVNLTGTFLCMQAAAKVMGKQRQGSIVNIASVVGQTGNPGQVNYTATKAGVMAMAKTAAKELAGRGVRVNAVAPGFIQTDMTAALPEKVVQMMLAMIPLGSYGQPEDIAAVVAFLCSEAARYVTGQVIHVNGGMFG
ncbi:3-oxoacyl-(acyl-carrier-protein) reductase [Desulfarculus baarsii DSM 2075]|uniref:3-oxoacyl-[acyl-carrier-protein] reductase n=1 Tax=Desulfarculus baarsii (strain ATCC 33931 / DSM 2075 / LMG 7858 / VKM B-1802 / 2st14) TaxID=644282 RepID=E1QJK7_DESB2|nr:3-oxoacyl-[acyl-carrier-protein] reductase [Desulfarculus baarsii]ADK85750.1 3-oxoacyl-(acyl-carrier-protein) reductase [Desulfarculus baarsii DSM 2075]